MSGNRGGPDTYRRPLLLAPGAASCRASLTSNPSTTRHPGICTADTGSYCRLGRCT